MTLTLEKNALDSLARALTFLQESKTDDLALKWFIIALHHAVHCLMLSALAGSAQEGIWKEPIQYRNREDDLKLIDVFHPKNKLLNFLDAYGEIKIPERMSRYTHSKHFVTDQAHDDAMEFLNNNLRNALIHYRPAVFGMSYDYIAGCAPVIDVIEFLLFESGLVIQLDPEVDKDRIKAQIQALKIEVEALKNVEQGP